MGATPIQYTPAGNVTVKAASALSGGTFAAVSAGMDGRNPVAAPAEAGSVPLGVVAHDCPAGGYVAVYRNGMYDVAAEGSIAAGGPVAVAAGGAATAAAAGEGAHVVGVAVSNASGGTVTVALN